MRRRQANGNEDKVALNNYKAAQGAQKEKIREAIIRAYVGGVSTGDVQETIDWDKGASASEVSRVWAVEGAKLLAELQNRRFDQQKLSALTLDGIRLSNELTAVVALGFTITGEKVILDFEVGSSD